MDDIDFKTAAEMVIEKDIEKKLNELNLKANQCQGGRDAWIAERRAALTIAHTIMEKNNMDFRDANKKAWSYVQKERNKPCVLPQEEPTGEGEQVDELEEQEPTEEVTLEQMEQEEGEVDVSEPTSTEKKYEEQPRDEK